MQHLSRRERSVVGLLARAPGIDTHLLERLGGAGFVRRAAVAGVPLRRQITGALDVANASVLRTVAIDPDIAATLADDMLGRERALEAIGLVLDAGDHERATAMMKGLSESVTDTVEPRPLLSLLARLGSTAEREPALLLLRAEARRAIGRVDEAINDLDQAVVLAATAPAPLRRRVAIEAARARMAEGDRDDAERIAIATLAELGDGEGRTYARAHEVLAECAATSDAREDLQTAAESYRVAANAWESCGEFARARMCRSSLALVALTPLGRFDEALAQIGQLLASPDLSDAERSWTVYSEGFVLLNANRLDSAESRFMRLADLGYLHDNPRLIAAAAWGMAVVAQRRTDLPGTLRWIATAENTALGEADDMLGVPFLCDAAMMLGALGELEPAATLPRPRRRTPGRVPRPGDLGDVHPRRPQRHRRRRRRGAGVHAPRGVVAGEARRRPCARPPGRPRRGTAHGRRRHPRARRARFQRLHGARRGTDLPRAAGRPRRPPDRAPAGRGRRGRAGTRRAGRRSTPAGHGPLDLAWSRTAP